MIRYLGPVIGILTGLWWAPAVAQPTAEFLTGQTTPPASTVRVGTKELPPFVTVQPAAAPYGYSADLWNAIADDLSLQTEWVAYESVSEMLDGLRQGDVDVAIAGISDRKSTRLNSSHPSRSRMPSSA